MQPDQNHAIADRHTLRSLAAALSLALAGLSGAPLAQADAHSSASPIPPQQLSNSWYEEGAAAAAARAMDGEQRARNVILFVGDGMGVSTVTAARILDGQLKGGSGEENRLSFEYFPFTGLSKTYNTDAQTPDSAGTMSAMITGVKTRMGMFGLSEEAQRGDCASGQGRELITALELAELAGKATGIVSTARITHATPAATYARSVDRDWEDDSELPEAASAAGCVDIASQLIGFEANLRARYPQAQIDGMEVILGGGRRHFLPKAGPAQSAPGSTAPTVSPYGAGRRSDAQDLIARWQQNYPQGHYVADREALLAAPAQGPLLGLFSDSHMRYEMDRTDSEPSLTEMTTAAIARLQNNPQGFFLMVESGRIDHAHHAGNAAGALHDTIEFAKAIAAAAEQVDTGETLIIVTADHSHVFTMAGYPRRGNPILGKVVLPGQEEPALALDQMPYTTLGYANGRGFWDLGAQTNADAGYALEPHAGRADLREVDTTAPGYHQEALVPLGSETHGGEDVAIYAIGPGAHRLSGVHEQNVIYHVMEQAAALEAGAAQALQGR
jgi:alkaline phosphatase